MRDAIAVVESVSLERTSERTTREMFVDDVSMAEDSCGAGGSQSALLLIRRIALSSHLRRSRAARCWNFSLTIPSSGSSSNPPNPHRPPSSPTASRRNGFQAARTELPAELALSRRHQQRQGIEGVTLDKRPCDTRLLRLQDREHHPQQRLHGMSGPIGDARTAIDPSAQIATEHSPWAQTSTVGVWIDAGSRAETDKTNGTAHFLEHLAFKVRRDA
jgi:hypothetical protein